LPTLAGDALGQTDRQARVVVACAATCNFV
jgi:hypothetical protein